MFTHIGLKLGALAKEPPSKSTLGKLLAVPKTQLNSDSPYKLREAYTYILLDVLHKATDLGPKDYAEIKLLLNDRMYRWHASGGVNIKAESMRDEAAYADARAIALTRAAECSDEVFKAIFETFDDDLRQDLLDAMIEPKGLDISASDPLKFISNVSAAASMLDPSAQERIFAALAPVVQEHKDRPLPENAGKWLLEEAAIDANVYANFLKKAAIVLKTSRPEILQGFIARRETFVDLWHDFTRAQQGRDAKAHAALEACADVLEIAHLERFTKAAMGTDAQNELDLTRSKLAMIEASPHYDEAFDLYAAKGDLTALFDAVSELVVAQRAAEAKPELKLLAGSLRGAVRARFAEMFLDGDERLFYAMSEDDDLDIPSGKAPANDEFNDSASVSL